MCYPPRHARRRRPRMTADEFLEWCQHQDDRYEFVDGEPVLMGDWVEIDGRPILMAGAKDEHDVIVVKILGELADPT